MEWWRAAILLNFVAWKGNMLARTPVVENVHVKEHCLCTVRRRGVAVVVTGVILVDLVQNESRPRVR